MRMRVFVGAPRFFMGTRGADAAATGPAPARVIQYIVCIGRGESKRNERERVRGMIAGYLIELRSRVCGFRAELLSRAMGD